MTAFQEYPPAQPNLPAPVTPPVVAPPAPTPAPVYAGAPAPTTATKGWITLVGGLLSTFVPYAVAQSAEWPQPWPAVMALVGWLATSYLTHKVPNKPIAVPEK